MANRFPAEPVGVRPSWPVLLVLALAPGVLGAGCAVPMDGGTIRSREVPAALRDYPYPAPCAQVMAAAREQLLGRASETPSLAPPQPAGVLTLETNWMKEPGWLHPARFVVAALDKPDPGQAGQAAPTEPRCRLTVIRIESGGMGYRTWRDLDQEWAVLKKVAPQAAAALD